jgi:hypothetical protein
MESDKKFSMHHNEDPNLDRTGRAKIRRPQDAQRYIEEKKRQTWLQQLRALREKLGRSN